MRRLLMVFLAVLAAAGTVTAEPEIQVAPDPLKFGYISIGGVQQREIKIYNVGDMTLIIDSTHAPQPFFIEQLYGISIEPAESLIVETGFMPDEESDYAAEFEIYNNAMDAYYHLPVTAHGVRAFEPGEIIWSYQHIENVVCLAATEDYNGDGLPDVVAEGFDSGAQGDPLICFSGSGDDQSEIIWSVQPEGGPSNSGGYGDQCLAYIDDLNGDGFGDLLRGGAWGSRTVFAINGLSGETIWSYDTYEHTPSGWIYSVAQTGDLNGDGVPEALACAGSDANRGYCFDGATGGLIWQRAADDGVSSIISIGDVDDDGLDEAVMSSLDNGTHVYCVSGASQGNGTIIWIYNVGDNTYTLDPIGDLNDDGYLDVIAGTWGSGVMALSGYSESDDGLRLWRFPLMDYVMRVVSCPDLNDDGYDDVLVASWANFALAISGVDGSELWRYDCGDDVWAIDFTNDINGDGKVEVIAGSFTNNVYLIDGASGALVWQTPVGAKATTVRGIGDINGDGHADVIAGTQMLSGVGGEVFVLSGWQPAISIKDNAPDLPDNFMAATNYPNPFNSRTIIKFNLPANEQYALSIYDIIGRLVEKFEGIGQVGNNAIKWDLAKNTQAVSGIYFYRITTPTRTAQGKMTYLK